MKTKKYFKRILTVTLLVMVMCFAVPTMAAAVPNLIGGNVTSMSQNLAGNSYGIDQSLPIILSFDENVTASSFVGNPITIVNTSITDPEEDDTVTFNMDPIVSPTNEVVLRPTANYNANNEYILTYRGVNYYFKTKTSGGGGQNASVYLVGASVDNGDNFACVRSGAYRIPVDHDIFFTFTNNIPRYSKDGHDNFNGILLYEWTDPLNAPTGQTADDFETLEDWEEVLDRTMTFAPGENDPDRWYVYVSSLGGLEDDTFYGLHVRVPTPNLTEIPDAPGYNNDGICANNNNPLTVEKRVIFKTEE